MPPSEKTADDLIADLLSPRQAIEILDRAYKDSGLSKRTLLERLRGGMVKAVSATSTFHGGHRDHAEVFYKIPIEDWEKVRATDDFWITGQFDFSRREYGSNHDVKTRHYNVRFEPPGVHSIVGTLGAAQPLQDSAPDDDAAKGKPVSPEALKAWFDVYRKVYGGSADDTLENAHKSARGMFPGRFVSRDRVRELAGGRTPGRKARNGD